VNRHPDDLSQSVEGALPSLASMNPRFVGQETGNVDNYL